MNSDDFDIFKSTPSREPSTTDVIRKAVTPPSSTSEALLDSINMLDKTVPTILIIDDDFNVRDSLEFAFEQDYKLIFCASGEEGIKQANIEVSAVILDIKMQGKDGFQTFTEIKQKFSHLPIIFHSAFQNLKDPYEIMNEFHPFGYISKEGGIQELSTTLASAIEYHIQIRKNAVLVEQLQTMNSQLENKVEDKTEDLQDAVEALVEKNTALVAAEQKALAAVDSKAMFLANMSHEIRTPMNAVISMTELLMDTPLDDEQRDWLEIVLSSGESLLNIINDILDFSKIEANKLELEQSPFELHACIESSLDILAIRAAQAHLNLSYYIDPKIPKILLGDMTRLRQILLNLISNAIKFTENGEICVAVSCVEQSDEHIKMQFAVQDTGIGIAKDKLKQLFQAFTQAESSTTREYGDRVRLDD